MLVKERLTGQLLDELRAKSRHIVYAPVDLWKEEQEYLSQVPFLKEVDLIFVHSERLKELLRINNIPSVFVEHYNKYTINTNRGFKETGKVLWIGGYEHAPLIIDYLERNKLNFDMDMLTSLAQGASLLEARRIFKLLGFSADFKGFLKSFENIKTYTWTENIQKLLMEQAKTGMDIKNVLFWGQKYKPPTKAQQFISSGIPFACNKESYSYEYFKNRGFEIPEPGDTDRWFSYEYWQKTNTFKAYLNELISLTAVGKMYKTSLDLL